MTVQMPSTDDELLVANKSPCSIRAEKGRLVPSPFPCPPDEIESETLKGKVKIIEHGHILLMSDWLPIPAFCK